MTIGESIRHHRKKLNLTQTQLAERLSVTPQAVSKWESGAGLPDLSMAVPLARALGTTTDELLRFGERYREFEDRWKQTLQNHGVNAYTLLLQVAEDALREFHWDKPFLYRAAVTADQIAETTQDASLKEEYLGRAAVHAQLLLEMDPEDQYHSKALRKDIQRRLNAIWMQK
jgi:transcriptional regulator with XRE-family HTH domain